MSCGMTMGCFVMAVAVCVRRATMRVYCHWGSMVIASAVVMNMHRCREPGKRPARQDHQDRKSTQHLEFRGQRLRQHAAEINAKTPSRSTRWLRESSNLHNSDSFLCRKPRRRFVQSRLVGGKVSKLSRRVLHTKMAWRFPRPGSQLQ